MRNKDMTSHEFCTAVQICNVVDNENKAGFVPRRLCNICQVSDLRNAVGNAKSRDAESNGAFHGRGLGAFLRGSDHEEYNTSLQSHRYLQGL